MSFVLTRWRLVEHLDSVYLTPTGQHFRDSCFCGKRRFHLRLKEPESRGCSLWVSAEVSWFFLTESLDSFDLCLITQQTDTWVTFPLCALLPAAVNPVEALLIFIELRLWFNMSQVHILNCFKGCRANFTSVASCSVLHCAFCVEGKSPLSLWKRARLAGQEVPSGIVSFILKILWNLVWFLNSFWLW